MVDTGELAALLHSLSAATSPLQRAQLLARGWRTIRRMSPRELTDLARRAGFDGAEQLLEGLARRKGKLDPAALLGLLHRARDTDGKQLLEFRRTLRDPKRRREMIDGGIDALAARLAGPGDDNDAEPAAESVAGASPAEPVPAELPPDGPAPVEPAPVELPPKEAAPADRAPVEPPPAEPKPVGDTSADAGVAEPLPAEPAPIEAVVPAAAVTVVARPVKTFGSDELLHRLDQAGLLIHRLRVLDREAARARDLNAEQLERLLERFPAGWARRRALSRLLRERIPADLGQALALIDGLPSSAARRWCVGTIRTTWPLTSVERARVERRSARPE